MGGVFSGGMSIDETAKELFCEWLTKLDDESASQLEFEGILGAFYSRLATYTLKFALLYQADLQATNYPESRERIVTPEAMEYAIQWTQYLKEQISILLGDIAFNDAMINRLKILKLIKAEPGITRSKALKSSRLSKKDFDEAILTLLESEQIAGRTEKTTRRPKTCYYGIIS